MYEILSQSVGFCRLYQKHFGAFFLVHSVVTNTTAPHLLILQTDY